MKRGTSDPNVANGALAYDRGPKWRFARSEKVITGKPGRGVSMNEPELRGLIAAVKAGRVSRRTFTRRMVGLGLTVPFASQILAHAGLAQSPAPLEYKPTRAGGGGALRTLFWQSDRFLPRGPQHGFNATCDER